MTFPPHHTQILTSAPARVLDTYGMEMGIKQNAPTTQNLTTTITININARVIQKKHTAIVKKRMVNVAAMTKN